MRSYLWPVTVLLVLLSVTASFASDTVFMPTGNSVAKGKFEYNFIFVDLDPPAAAQGSSASASPRSLSGPPKHLMIHEFFFGATDRLEIDVDVLDADGLDPKVEINPYLTLVKESPNRPSFIVGVYNLFGEDFPTGPGGDSRVSPFFVSSYNLRTPAAAPSLSDPLIRGHLGWGTGQHDSDFFGGAQFLINPKYGGAVYTHHGAMAYVGVYRPKKCLEIRGGTLDGDEWGSFGVFVDW
jgi:hypothetical protein